jgi:hypothetical protein
VCAGLGQAEELETKEQLARLRAEAQRDNRVMDHLRVLCEAIGPRLTGSDGIARAYTWTKTQFESWGLKAHLEEWGSYPVGFDRGPSSSGRMIVGDESVELKFGTHAWTAGTRGAVRGRAVLAPKSIDDMTGLEGAWVLKTRRARGKAARAYDDALFAAGIAGVVRSTRGELILTGGSVGTAAPNMLPTRVRVNLVKSQFEELAARLKKGEDVDLEFDIDNRFLERPYKHYNVVAEIKGVEKPDEVVIVGGHLDSWDGANGATDNGTGVATTLEAARLLAASGARPRRTIRFVLWSGEEQGLLGSRAYVKAHKSEMSKISAVFVHDGGTNVCSGLAGTPAMLPQLREAFSGLIDDGSEFGFKLREVNGLRGGGSDHNSYLAAGVPGFFWTQEGKASYPYTHHTQHDNFDQAIAAYQKRSALVIASGALGVANLPDLLSREKLLAPRRKVLGVSTDGLTVTSVSEGSRAAKAGVREGDRFISAGGRAVANLRELRQAIQRANGPTEFVVERGGKKVTLTAVFPSEKKKATGKDWF